MYAKYAKGRAARMRPDIIIEHVSSLRIFFAETEQGREWLKKRGEILASERIGLSVAVEDEKLARDLADAAAADGLDVML